MLIGRARFGVGHSAVVSFQRTPGKILELFSNTCTLDLLIFDEYVLLCAGM